MYQLDLPDIGFGTAHITDEVECQTSVRRALELGYRHVDTAQWYYNEAYVGEGLAMADVSREEVIIATKVHHEKLGYEDLLSTTEDSLDKLGVETIDILYPHWPAKTYNPSETLAAFDRLHSEGRIEYVGGSNFTVELLEEARDELSAPLLCNQVEMHPLLQQEPMRKYLEQANMWLVAYAPLMQGDVVEVPEVRTVAEKHDATASQVTLSWMSEKSNVVAIPKARGAHIEENYRARHLDLDSVDVERIDGIERTRRIIDPPIAPW